MDEVSEKEIDMEYNRLVVRFSKENMIDRWKKTGSIAVRVAGFGEALGLFATSVFEQERMVYFTAPFDTEVNLPEIGQKILSMYGGDEPPLCILQKCREFAGKSTVLEEYVIFPATVRYALSWFDESESRRGCSGSMPLKEIVDGVAVYEASGVSYRNRDTRVVAKFKREGDALVLTD